ncbi:MAG TPA: hypothetical protein VM938_12305 [Acidimicrobiales bacterium]|nr:hypothetical protein [Acidimicrobiales bacterium]
MKVLTVVDITVTGVAVPAAESVPQCVPVVVPTAVHGPPPFTVTVVADVRIDGLNGGAYVT